MAPTKDDCQHEENCNTLEEYVKTGAFNQSNVMWIFKKGEHVLKPSITAISNVTDVTFTGETDCEHGHHRCTVKCRRRSTCMLLFVGSRNITILHLYFDYHGANRKSVSQFHLQQYIPKERLCYNQTLGFSISEMHFNNCLDNRKLVFVDTTHLTVRNATFTGRNSYWAVVRPSGRYDMINCQFHELYLAQSLPSPETQHYFMVVLRAPENGLLLSLNMQNNEFNADYFLPPKSFYSTVSNDEVMMTYPAVHIISDEPLNEWKANITIDNCSFSRCSPFQLSALEDPGLSVTLNNVQADSGVSNIQSSDWSYKRYQVMGSAVRILLANHRNQRSETQCPKKQHLELSNITVSSSHFSKSMSVTGSAVLFNERFAEHCPASMRLVLRNNTFSGSHSVTFRSVVYAYLHRIHQKPANQSMLPQHYRLIIDSNNMSFNFHATKIDKSCVVLERSKHRRSQYLISPETGNGSCNWQGVYFISGFKGSSRVLFTENTIQDNRAQGLTLSRSEVVLKGTNTMYQNQGYYGGGVAMYKNSQLLFMNGAYLNISSNHAFVQGGGMYIEDYCTSLRISDKCPCFFQFIDSNGSYLQNATIGSLNVSAFLLENRIQRKCAIAAAMIFNPNTDDCHLYTTFPNSTPTDALKQIFHLPDNITSKDISSVPKQICPCTTDEPVRTCNGFQREEPLPAYPGQQLKLNVMLIGDMGVSMGGVLYVELEGESYSTDDKIYLPLPIHSTHILHRGCNTLTLPPLPFRTRKTWILQFKVPLQHDKTPSIFLTDYLHLQHFTDCPLGYKLVSNQTCDQTGCECYSFLQEKVECLKSENLFELKRNYWIGRESEHQVLLSGDCPRVYCAKSYSRIRVSLNESDKQCEHSRTGVLCGSCPKGNSSVLYSFACRTCTNWGVLLVIPFLLAGPLLIALICCLNLTISVGSINGFLLYINMIGIHRDVLTIITGDSTLGLRLLGLVPADGVCIYNGMDEFASTLLTYLFPMYLLTLVVVICLLPKCKCVNMHKINRRIGPRITPVLATVILLSYTQLAESVIHSLLYATLFSTDGTTTTSSLRWMFDGSLEYFHSPKHIILACLAILVLTCFLLPVTVVALFGDLFRRFFRGPWYMNFLDSLHGAFRFRFGFWIGIRILLRILSIFSKIFLPVDVLFRATAYVLMTLLFLQILIRPFRGIRVEECVSKKMKEKHFSEPLQRELVHSIDHSFLVNLIAVFMYPPHSARSTSIVLLISTVVAYAEFLCILVYHILEYSPVGPRVFETWFKLRRRYKRWREKRREAALDRQQQERDGTWSFEQQFDLVLRASDCKDSDYEDSESEEDTEKDSLNNHQETNETMIKQSSHEQEDWNSPADVSLSSGLTAPLLRKTHGNTQ